MVSSGSAHSTPSAWTRVRVSGVAINEPLDSCTSQRDTASSSFLELTNPLVPLPLRPDAHAARSGENDSEPTPCVRVLDNFVSDQEAVILQEQLLERQTTHSTWEGFDGPRRRVQQYALDLYDNDTDQTVAHSDTNDVPPMLLQLHRRLWHHTGLRATRVRMEEYTPVPIRWGHDHHTSHTAATTVYDPTIFSTFATPATTTLTSTFVVEIPLSTDPAAAGRPTTEWIQNWNQPARRHNMCWNLVSPRHATHVRLQCQTAIVKQGPLLSDWRSSRVVTLTDPSDVSHAPVVPAVVRMVQFDNLPPVTDAVPNHESEQETNETTLHQDAFGFVPTRQHELERQRRIACPPPPLADLLTIVVTTSPIKSNPSTEVIERAMGTFTMCGPDFAYACRKIIVCDGVRTLDAASNDTRDVTKQHAISRRHTNDKQAMRNGIVNTQQADNYRQYKQRLHQLCLDAESTTEPPSVFANTRLVELDERHGYGFAVRHVVQNCIETPYVCVIQHDRTFMRPTPVTATVHAMWHHAHVKYVGFSMRSNLMYRDIFLGKYGGGWQQQTQQDWNEMVLYLPELRLPATAYGPDSTSTREMQVSTDKIRHNILALAETYRASAEAAVQRPVPRTGASDHGTVDSQCQLSLVPTLYWYDNVHVVETSHYRDFVFDPSYKMVTRGGFIEDKLSPVLKRTVERLGLKDGHSRFGCYLLDDHSGYFFTGHIDGGSYLSQDERQALVASQKSKPP